MGLGISVLATRLLEPALEMTLNISPSIAALSVGFRSA